ncbi:BTB/POZ and MATH domain-containing protein 1-like [Setaria italica]|uniref:BTB/POZ and MATH domain-containing protein 1-like n=1 Tax=Setaria italica TaxID=4555 RepID=UPI000BE55D30|nr:BTB/POZ and MATH domain-containing protein 1-like [Setaria italica]
MATTTALLSASVRRLAASSFTAARRLSSLTASSIIPREVTGSHKTFEAAGYRWRIWYGPYGHVDSTGSQHISLHLQVVHGASKTHVDPVEFKFSLLDQSENPKFTRATTELCCFNDGAKGRNGFEDFIKWQDLEESGCLKDDRFSVRCDITAMRNFSKNEGAAAPAPAHVVVPPSDLHEHLTDILWNKKQGTDVTIDVGGEATVDAHGWLLAARSPVFQAELLASKKEKPAGGGACHRRIEIQGVEPEVFKAVLHYMFKLDRLRLMCEETLCKRIDVTTLADTLAVAERHGCRGLSPACLEFISCPGNLKAVVATEGLEELRAKWGPALLTELFVMNQLMAT